MLFKPLWMLHIQLEVTVVTEDFCKRIRALCVNVVGSEWLSTPQSPWHAWLPAVKKQSDPRALMPRISTGKCCSHGQVSACLPCRPLKWAWLTPASSRCLINTYWVNKLAFSELALAISLSSLSFLPLLEAQRPIAVNLYLLTLHYIHET